MFAGIALYQSSYSANILNQNICEMLVIDPQAQIVLAARELGAGDVIGGKVAFNIPLDPIAYLGPEYNHQFEVEFFESDESKNLSQVKISIQKNIDQLNYKHEFQTREPASMNDLVLKIENFRDDDQARRYQLQCNKIPI